MTKDEAILKLQELIIEEMKVSPLFNLTYTCEALDMAIEALKGEQSYQQTIYKLTETIKEKDKREQWISSYERLPQKSGWYIITHKDLDNSDIAFWNRRWWVWLNKRETVVKDVLAWRPLPEPYKENEHDE